MNSGVDARSRLAGIPRYWFVIIFLLLIAGGIYLYHLTTGYTPGRAAFRIPVVNLEVYWYGIWIVGGIALGSFVVASLARERAEGIFARTVPAVVRKRAVAVLELPDEMSAILTRHRITTLGDLVLQWGFDPRGTGLNQAGIAELQERLEQEPDIDSSWLSDAPWRVWNPEHVWNGIIWVLIFAVIGARLYHVLTPSPSMAAVGIESPLDYLRNPYQLLNFRSGGLGIYGGIAGGALGLLIYTRRQRISALAWADLGVVGLALGQTFGRWGNFFNQELYGRPTTLPWAVYIDPAYRLPAYAEFATFHPAFLYESLWNLLTFVVLYTLARRYADQLLTGELMGLYLIAYAIGRTLLETVRLDSRAISVAGLDINLAVATLVSILIAISAAAWMIYRRRHRTAID